MDRSDADFETKGGGNASSVSPAAVMILQVVMGSAVI